jgi:hypothetical protein
LGATLHLGNPCLSIARLDVRFEACQKLRRYARAFPFGELESVLEHVFSGRGHE